MDHCIPNSLLFPSHLETQGMSMRYAQRHTPLFTGAGNPTLIDTSRSIPNGVDKIVEDARQKKQNGLEFQQNVCKFPGGVNCYHSLGNRETMPVCLSWRTSYLIGITDNSALCLICTSEFLCAAVLLCEQLLSPTRYLQLKKKWFSPWTHFKPSLCEDLWHRDCVESKLKLQWMCLPTWSQIRAEDRFCILNIKFLLKV